MADFVSGASRQAAVAILKITFVLPFASLAGGTRVVATYASKLHTMGHDVTVVSQPRKQPKRWTTRLSRRLRHPLRRTGQGTKTPLLEFLGDRHVILDRRRPITPEDLPDADVIIATWWETAEWVAQMPQEKGKKFYLIQDYEVFDQKQANRVADTFKLPLRKLAVSTYISDIIYKNHGTERCKIIPNAVDRTQFDAPSRMRNTPLTVGFVYTTVPRKRVDLTIHALELAKTKCPDLIVRAFGTSPPSSTHPLPSWIEYQANPKQDEIPKLYAACDLWLLTSDHEGFGLPLLEAMACRTPVLSTHAGAAPDLINGKNGLLLPSDPHVFAQKISEFYRMDPAEWQHWSNAAYETIRGHTWDDATQTLLQHLDATP